LAFNFNNEPPGGPPGPATPSPFSPGPSSPAPTNQEPAADAPAVNGAATATVVTSDNPQSAAFVRFGSCRWQEPADKETGAVAFCTHREVKPYAGTQTFDADAWCPDCQYYKLRRAPKKRERTDDYSY
jgi:hypothetical protein